MVWKKSFLVLVMLTISLFGGGVKYIDIQPLKRKIVANFSEVQNDRILPILTWGADSAIIKANGDSKATKPNSLIDKVGYRFELQKNDDFVKQLNDYVSGKTPFLRATVGMLSLANDIFAKNPALKPVVFHQLSWSDGGDALVVNSQKIKTLKDLKGKTIVVQYPGPHIDMLASTLKIAGLSMSDVKIKGVPDLTETTNSDPASAMRLDKNIDASFVILPDALALTNNGTVGTGAEGSVKGAKILFNTKGTKIISDVLAVRNDYYKKNQAKINNLANALFKAQKMVKNDYFQNKASFKIYAKIILGGSDLEGLMRDLYGDMRPTNFQDNKIFLSDNQNSKSLKIIAKDSTLIFSRVNLVSNSSQILLPLLDWENLAIGVDTTKYKLKKNSAKMGAYVSNRQKLHLLEDDTIISFVIHFRPNQTSFSASMYEKEFKKVLEVADTFAGSVITIEGHSDNLKFLKSQKAGKSPYYLKQLRQSARNLSLKRAASVRDSIVSFSKEKNGILDKNQFTIIGYGIEKPLHNPPKNKRQWLENMRVEFRLIKTDAELIEFEPI